MPIVLLTTFIILLIFSVPISVSLGMAATTALIIGDIPVMMLVQRMISSINSFPIMAIIFFMLSGEVMCKGNMTKKLIAVAERFVGHINGGLAIAGGMSATFFSAISGSSAATCASIGTVMIDEMHQKGYPKDRAAAVIAASAITGIIIPPSVTLVVYGVVTGTSVGKLFIGGFIPGLMIGLSLIITSWFIAKKYGYGEITPFNVKKIFETVKNSIWVLAMPVIILGGIYGGIFTPTEAAVVSVVYSLFVTIFIDKSLTLADYIDIVKKGCINSAVVLFIIMAASVFSWILTTARVPQAIGEFCIGITDNKIIFLMILNVVLLIAGTLVTGSATVSILAPIFLPVAVRYGIDPVFLGVLMVINLAIGYITPPVGVDLYVAGAIAKIPVDRVIKRIIPYLIVLIMDLLVLTYVPFIITFLPSLMK